MLTVKKLKEMKPDTIFASGIGWIEHPWFAGRQVKVKWVAARGGIDDWAIYHSFDSNFVKPDSPDDSSHLNESNERIAGMGTKLHNKAKIREFVPCTDEAFSRYRH